MMLLVYVVGATILVTGHSIDLRPPKILVGPAIGAPDGPADEPVWMAPWKGMEPHLLVADCGDARCTDDFDDTYIRPAWGMLTAMVTAFLYILGNGYSLSCWLWL
jgi:hypothetical protein